MTNKELIESYPFLRPRNRWTDKIIEDADYTELDAMEPGWREAFGEQMCQEIKEALIKSEMLDSFRILDIKEKYGMLRFYCNVDDSQHSILNIIGKYENLSKNTCCKCGEATDKKHLGLPLCDSCIEKIEERIYSLTHHD